MEFCRGTAEGELMQHQSLTGTDAVVSIAQGWLVRLTGWEGKLKGEAIPHKFLLPRLSEACHISRLETTDSIHILHIRFFQQPQTVDFVLVWGDTSWENARKYLFRRYKLKAGLNVLPCCLRWGWHIARYSCLSLSGWVHA